MPPGQSQPVEVRVYLSFKAELFAVTFVPERFADWEEHMAKLMSKSELIQKIADQHSNGLTRKDIKGVIESLARHQRVLMRRQWLRPVGHF